MPSCPSPFCDNAELEVTPTCLKCPSCGDEFPLPGAVPPPRAAPAPRARASHQNESRTSRAPEATVAHPVVQKTTSFVPVGKPAYSEQFPTGVSQHDSDTLVRDKASGTVRRAERATPAAMPEGGFWWFVWLRDGSSGARTFVGNIQGRSREEAEDNARASEWGNREYDWQAYDKEPRSVKPGAGRGKYIPFRLCCDMHARQPTDKPGPLPLVGGDEVAFKRGQQRKEGTFVGTQPAGLVVRSKGGEVMLGVPDAAVVAKEEVEGLRVSAALAKAVQAVKAPAKAGKKKGKGKSK